MGSGGGPGGAVMSPSGARSSAVQFVPPQSWSARTRASKAPTTAGWLRASASYRLCSSNGSALRLKSSCVCGCAKPFHQARSTFLLDDHGHPRATSPTPHWLCMTALQAPSTVVLLPCIVAGYVRCHISGLRSNFKNRSTSSGAE